MVARFAVSVSVSSNDARIGSVLAVIGSIQAGTPAWIDPVMILEATISNLKSLDVPPAAET